MPPKRGSTSHDVNADNLYSVKLAAQSSHAPGTRPTKARHAGNQSARAPELLRQLVIERLKQINQLFDAELDPVAFAGLTLHPLAGGLADPEIACDCCPVATFGLTQGGLPLSSTRRRLPTGCVRSGVSRTIAGLRRGERRA